MEYEYVPLITSILFAKKNKKILDSSRIFFNFFVFSRLRKVIEKNPHFLLYRAHADSRYYIYEFEDRI
jgi:hypothetical protein